MKNTIVLNHKAKEIEITRTFERASNFYGSDEYFTLKSAREDFPTYTVRVKTPPKKSIFNDITVEQIEKYFEKKGDEKSLAELQTLKDNAITDTQIRTWFVSNHKEIKDCKTKANLILAMIG